MGRRSRKQILTWIGCITKHDLSVFPVVKRHVTTKATLGQYRYTAEDEMSVNYLLTFYNVPEWDESQ